MGHNYYSLSIDATIMVSKNCPIIGEHAGTEFFQTLPKVASHPAYQNSVIRKKFTVPFLKYKPLKLKLRVFLAGHSVAMVTYNVTKRIPTCSPMIGQFFDTMIVASTDKEW